MDSGNSGSIQSSSGGDEEFDSRGGSESISSFLINPLPHDHDHFGNSISTPNQPFITHQNPTFFNPQNPQILDHNSFLQSNPNSQYNSDHNNNNDLIWSRGLRSHEPNYGNLGNLTTTTSSSSVLLPSINATPSSTVQQRLDSDQPKNPKKRTRASRRAPTTVLTTDTTNFRQMVQEFTGIPAAPFTSTSPYARRMDLFSAASALRSGASAHLDALGPLYPLRPSPHKVSENTRRFYGFSANSMAPVTNISSTNNTTTMATSATLGASTLNNSNNYPLVPSDHHHHHLLINDLQQTVPLQLSLNKHQLGENNNAHMNYGNMSGFQSHDHQTAPSSQVMRINNDHNENFSRSWRNNNNHNDGVEENLVSTFDHSNSSTTSASDSVLQHVSSTTTSGYNLNLSHKPMDQNVVVSSGPDHQGNVAASWICPTD